MSLQGHRLHSIPGPPTPTAQHTGESPRKFKASQRAAVGRGSHSQARAELRPPRQRASARLRAAGGPCSGARARARKRLRKLGKGLFGEKGAVVNLTAARRLRRLPQPPWPLPAEGAASRPGGSAAPGKPELLRRRPHPGAQRRLPAPG